MLFDDMAAGSGGQKNQFTSLHYWFEELEGVYIFKRVQNYSAYTYICIERTRKSNPAKPETEKEEKESVILTNCLSQIFFGHSFTHIS